MIAFLKRLDKRQLFLLIVALLVILTVIGSIIANFTYLSDDEAKTVRIAVVGPMSGPLAVNGEQLRQGAKLYADVINAEGGIRGGRVIVDEYDDKNDPAEAVKIAERIGGETGTIAVIGHWSIATTKAAAAVYGRLGIPMMSPAPIDEDVLDGNPWVFSAIFNTRHETAFAANYTRNVLGQKTASIIHDLSPKGEAMATVFDDTYNRFGTRVRYKWGFDSATDKFEARVDEIIADLKPKLDVGTIFIAAEEPQAAYILRKLRDNKMRNPVVGTSNLATRAFARAVAPTDEETAPYTNGIVAATPLLFDTANEEAQNFNSRYQNRFGSPSDWVAAYSFDAVHMLVEAFKRGKRQPDEKILAGGRRMIRDALAESRKIEDGIRGITGVKIFNAHGEAITPVLMGSYNGHSIVSALTQLQPIKQGTAANYIEELKQGRVLYVNDRFMYKTNVVYTGVQVKEISELDLEKGTVTIDLLLCVLVPT